MAVLAGVPGRDAAVGLLGRPLGSLYHIGNEHLVLLEHAHLMASLTGEIPVLAHLPRLERLLHHVTVCAELRVIFRIFIIAEPDDPARHRQQQEEKDDRLLVFLDEGLAE